MASNDDDHRSALTDAAGRVAFYPARAAARAWRVPLEEAVDEVLSAPEIGRVLDPALAGSLPEEIARSLVRHLCWNASLPSSQQAESWSGSSILRSRVRRRSSSRTRCSQATRRSALSATSPRAPSSETRSRDRQPGLRRRWSAACASRPPDWTTEPSRSSAARREPSVTVADDGVWVTVRGR
jgi:hypothetical protein